MLDIGGPTQHAGDAREHLDLWYTQIVKELSTAFIAQCELVLSDAELSRSQAFRFEKDRCRYLATRLLVRNALSRYFPTTPKGWQFQANNYGKPALHPDCGLRFNVSHSTEMVFCLIGRDSEIGVDAEPLIRASEITSVRNEFLSTQERAQFEALPHEERANRAITLWTLKEAYVKARGFGFSLTLEKVSFIFEEQDKIRVDLDPSLNDDAANWRFCLLDLMGHRVALAVETKNQPELQIWDAGPATSSKIQQYSDAQMWFPRMDEDSNAE